MGTRRVEVGSHLKMMVERPASEATPLHDVQVVVESFEAYYVRMFPVLIRLSWVITGSIDDAEEIVQEVFARIHTRFERLDNPDAYVHSAVVNECRRYFRRRATARRFAHRLVSGGAVDSCPDLLVDLVRGLPRRRRDAIVLRYYVGLNEAEMSDVMGVPKGTVKSLLSRALRQLREELGDD